MLAIIPGIGRDSHGEESPGYQALHYAPCVAGITGIDGGHDHPVKFNAHLGGRSRKRFVEEHSQQEDREPPRAA